MKIGSDYRKLPNFSWLSLFFPMSQISIAAWELTHGLPGAMVMRMDTVALSPEEPGIPTLKRQVLLTEMVHREGAAHSLLVTGMQSASLSQLLNLSTPIWGLCSSPTWEQ
jgi:hypothetical protein